MTVAICYGRSVKTIGDQLYGSRDNMTDEQKTAGAQKVYDSVLKAFPGLRDAMMEAQAQARHFGYVTTILGRRRHIPDMQLPPFEFVPMHGYVNPDVDPLDPSTFDNKDAIPERIVKSLTKEFAGFKYYGQIVKRTKQLAEEKIKVINNTQKITEASRECLNSRIQGSAAEQTKLALLLISNNDEWKRLGARVICPVHDEILAEVPIQNAERGGQLLSELMCKAAEFLPFDSKCDVETSFRWYGLSYPCPYPKPESIDDLSQLSADEIKWIQYNLFEHEYTLPIYKDENGEKPKGDAAKGVNGVVSEELHEAIRSYVRKYGITKAQFIQHIDTNTVNGRNPLPSEMNYK